ncbi:enoyl-CoA hydratase-related protein [Schinkia azotoformans]|uniref:enoyl-CoA hydratase-related protein n=1 Tax=Schinkia azotoformans TaxID=1454 RepID=UPI002DB880A4|nr:enoyl-CoA hydratase-related protein [Schinkia azotoformans]MEC1770477.1 enoyl-CoA hydratase-related protein [Schinkia azotoformans]MED4366654.1 enoyl-CoA hydratase-related protein [Schinkia azotoformans]
MAKVMFDVKNYIGYVTINRPEVLNCFDYETLALLGEIVDEIRTNKDVRVVIFTSAGNKAFSAGADLKERKTLPDSEVRRNVNKIRTVFNDIALLPQPTIAAVNGHAFGGGFELMLACDFRIAVKEATMGLTELKWAIIPGAGGTQRLPRLIGEAKAKEMILTAKKVSADEANILGVVTKVVEQENLMDECISLAEELMANGPVALQQAKYAINYGMGVDLQTGLAIEAKAYEMIIPTKDRVEALKAFSEKRPPNFIGK